MAIRMRTNKEKFAQCAECKNTYEKSLELFDIQIGNTIITICDECNEKILSKTLSAQCTINGMVKSKRDLKIISYRKNRKRS